MTTALPRCVVVTGASGRIGRVFVRELLEHNCEVIALTGSEASQNALRQDHAVAGDRLRVHALDLTVEDAAAGVLDLLAGHDLRPEALVLGARSLKTLAVPEDGRVRRDAFMGEYLLDVVVAYELAWALAHMPGSALASVVNIVSMYGITPYNPGLYERPAQQAPLQYGLAKAAQIQLTKELAVRLAPAVRVNAIAYGGVEGRVNQDFKQRYASLCPQGRMLNESDLAGPLLFLLSQASSATTGHTLLAEGGWTVW